MARTLAVSLGSRKQGAELGAVEASADRDEDNDGGGRRNGVSLPKLALRRTMVSRPKFAPKSQTLKNKGKKTRNYPVSMVDALDMTISRVVFLQETLFVLLWVYSWY